MDLDELLQLSVPWWEIVLRGCVVYVVLMVLIRLSGKRTVGQFTPFDLLVLVLLGDAVQGSMLAGDQSLPGGLLLAFTLLACNRLVGFATARSRRLEFFVEGRADILARNGSVDHAALRRADMTLDDLQEAMRENDCVAIRDLRLALLEKDGSITILKRRDGDAGGG
jgi:uncharacterized membrane protein YcaP (DUF421 family)